MNKSKITAVTLHITYEIRTASIARCNNPNGRYYPALSQASADRLQRALLAEGSRLALVDLDLPAAVFEQI